MTSTFISADQARDSADRSLRGIVELDTDSSWEIESSGVAATLAEYYGAGVTGSALSPPVDPADLRAEVDAVLDTVLAAATLDRPEVAPLARVAGKSGREGVHTEPFGYLLAELQSVARAHPDATW